MVEVELEQVDRIVIKIDSNQNKDDECENKFHGYDKVMGDMQK
jgi:hypothetical protein